MMHVAYVQLFRHSTYFDPHSDIQKVRVNGNTYTPSVQIRRDCRDPSDATVEQVAGILRPFINERLCDVIVINDHVFGSHGRPWTGAKLSERLGVPVIGITPKKHGAKQDAVYMDGFGYVTATDISIVPQVELKNSTRQSIKKSREGSRRSDRQAYARCGTDERLILDCAVGGHLSQQEKIHNTSWAVRNPNLPFEKAWDILNVDVHGTLMSYLLKRRADPDFLASLDLTQRSGGMRLLGHPNMPADRVVEWLKSRPKTYMPDGIRNPNMTIEHLLEIRPHVAGMHQHLLDERIEEIGLIGLLGDGD